MITSLAAIAAGTAAVLAFLLICWSLFGAVADKDKHAVKHDGVFDIDDDWA